LIILIGSAIGISHVMISTGAANLISNIIIGIFQNMGIYGILIGVYLLTLLLTEIITNNAAAALSFPIALSVAAAMNVSPIPFIMAIAYAASGSFLTPFGYQTNILVYSAGSYTFFDYFKTGLPLSIIYSLLVLGLIPVFFRF
jgi:di/tricarboxylate transporter